jgi:hypothetical protein
MGIAQTAFYTNGQASSSGIVVGSMWTPKKQTPTIKKSREPREPRERRSVTIPTNYTSKTPQTPPNPLTFGLLGCDF